MKFHFILFIILLISSSAARSQSSLAGKITDKVSGHPLAYATVSILDLHALSTADSVGNYFFDKIPAASYQVQVNALGYKTFSGLVTVQGATVVNFELDESATELDEIVVTGSSKAMEIKKSPLSLVSINRNYLTTTLSTNIIDAISKVPGVNAVTTGPNVSKPVIRGLGFTRILTLYDGMRQEGQQWGDEHGIEMDNYAFDRIEVIKGPASLLYGSDAIAGVINLIPNQPSAENKISGNVTTEYQSNNGMMGGSVFLSNHQREWEWGARLSQRLAKDFQNAVDGRVYGTAFRETDASGFVGIHKKWGLSHLRFSLFDNQQEIPDGSRDSLTRRFTKQITEADTYRPVVTNSELNSYDISVLHQRVQHYRAYLKNSFYFSNSRLDLNVGYQRSIRREYSHPEAPYQNLPGLYLQLNTLTYDAKYFLPEFKRWETVAGVNGMIQQNDVTQGTEFVIPSYHQVDVGSFVTVKREVGKWNIAGGVRSDVRSFSNDQLFTLPDPVSGFDRAVPSTTPGADQPFQSYRTTFSGLTGSVGFTYLPTDAWAIKLNVSRGYRAPNISEISANGVHPGTNLYQIGNSQFKPEFSNQVDVGASFTSRSVTASASFFVNQIEHYIYNQRLLSKAGKDSVRQSGSIFYPAYQFQQGRVVLYGLEANIDIHVIKPLHLDQSVALIYGDNYSFSGTQRTAATKYVPFMPPLRYIAELKYEWDKPKRLFDKPFVSVQVQYTAAQRRVFTYDNTETATAGYTLLNVSVGSGLKNKAGKSIFNVYVLANNVFDVAYQNHLSRLKYFEQYTASPTGHLGIYNMGRNIGIKLVKNF